MPGNQSVDFAASCRLGIVIFNRGLPEQPVGNAAQDMVPDVFKPNCVWIMSKQVRTAIRKLKDGEGNYLLNKDATTKWGYTLFGRPVYISDAVDSIASGKTPIYYGNFSGLLLSGVPVRLANTMPKAHKDR